MLTAFICKHFSKVPWCKSEEQESFPLNEPWELTLTESLEEDLKERFADIEYRDGWYFKTKDRQYKIIVCVRYQPYIADTNFHYRKIYCLIKPVIKSGKIETWELTWISNWLGWLPF